MIGGGLVVLLAGALSFGAKATAGGLEFLLRESFSGPQLTPGVWDAPPAHLRLNAKLILALLYLSVRPSAQQAKAL